MGKYEQEASNLEANVNAVCSSLESVISSINSIKNDLSNFQDDAIAQSVISSFNEDNLSNKIKVIIDDLKGLASNLKHHAIYLDIDEDRLERLEKSKKLAKEKSNQKNDVNLFDDN